MKTSTIVVATLVILVILGGGYWLMNRTPASPTDLTTTETATTTDQVAAPALGAATSSAMYMEGNLLLGVGTGVVASSSGSYLVGDNAMTLYLYTKDKANVSNCTARCAQLWPPYTVASTSALANLQAGVNGKVGTIKRADGSLQVTYNEHPLYFWTKDMRPGDTTGEGVAGVWHVVKP